MSNWLHPDNSHEFTTAMAYWLLDGVTSNNSSCQYCKPPISPTRSNAYKENE